MESEHGRGKIINLKAWKESGEREDQIQRNREWINLSSFKINNLEFLLYFLIKACIYVQMLLSI